MNPRIGAKVFSTTQWYGDGFDQGSSTPKSGIVFDCFEILDIDTGEMVPWVRAVQQYRGAIRYHSFRSSEIEYGEGEGEPNSFFIGGLVRAMAEDMARNGADHVAAIMSLRAITREAAR